MLTGSQKELYEAALATSMDGVALVGPDSRFRDVNEALCAMVGRTREEMLGLRLADVGTSLAAEDVLPAMERIREKGKDRFESRWRRKDGTLVDMEIQVAVVEGDEPVLFSFVSDISDRKAADRALRASADRLRMARDAARLGTWEHDVATGVVVYDGRAMEHRGLGRPVVRLEDGMDRVHPDDLEAVRAAVAAAVDPATGTGHEKLVHRVRNPGGETRWRSVQVDVRFEGEGARRRAVTAFGTSQDVTDLRRAEEAVQRGDALHRLFAENSAVVFWTLDLETMRFPCVSPAIERMRGYTAAEAMGQSLEEVLAPASLRKARELLAEVAGEGDLAPRTEEFDQVRRDGSVVTTEISLRVVSDAAGHRQVVGVTRDVTERRRREKGLWKGELLARRKDGSTFRAGVVTDRVLDADWTPICVFGSFEDVTERRRLAETIRLEKERFERASRSGKVAMWDAGLSTGGLVASGSAHPGLCLRPGETMTLDGFLSRLHPDDRTAMERAMVAHLEKGTPFDGEARVRRADGSYLRVRDVGEALRDRDGVPYGLSGVMTDITEIKEAEAALVATKARLEEAPALAGLGSWARDLATGRIEWSPEVYRVLEVDPSATPPSQDVSSSAIRPEDRPASTEEVARAIGEGTSIERIHRLLLPGGRVERVRDRVGIERGEDGAPLRVAGTTQDITEHLLAREARQLAEAIQRGASTSSASSTTSSRCRGSRRGARP